MSASAASARPIESAAIPIPSELILPFAGWSVSRGLAEPLTGGGADVGEGGRGERQAYAGR